MKRFLFFLLAAMLIVGASAVAVESNLIDFSTLDPDILPDGAGNPVENRRTIMDYSIAAGASFTPNQKVLMKSSLTLRNWEVVLNSSASTVEAIANSYVVNAPVKESAEVPFAGKNVMGVRVYFPLSPVNANARIVPPFEIPAYEPFIERDDNGDIPANSQKPKEGEKPTFFEAENATDPLSVAYGVVKNVGVIKAIKVSVMGDAFPHGLYVLLKDTDGIERRYFMGYLKFDGWKELRWNNPHYLTDARAREIRVYPIYPRGLPYVKFVGFQVTRDAAHVGGDFISYFKDVSLIYDKAVLTTERDIAEEDLWGIITKKEAAKQNAEIQRFGSKQVDRYVEREKMATEDAFTSSIVNEQ
jgi:hypothetical protein